MIGNYLTHYFIGKTFQDIHFKNNWLEYSSPISTPSLFELCNQTKL